MNDVLATRVSETRKGTATVDDLARQLADLKRQIEGRSL